MTAFKNNSDMTLAIEGARGPPGSQKRNLFPDYFNCHYSNNKVRSTMSQPKKIRSGFKSPPLETLKGRGPPTTKKRVVAREIELSDQPFSLEKALR